MEVRREPAHVPELPSCRSRAFPPSASLWQPLYFHTSLNHPHIVAVVEGLGLRDGGGEKWITRSERDLAARLYVQKLGGHDFTLSSEGDEEPSEL